MNCDRNNTIRHAAGLTLVEMMWTVLTLAIITALALPMYHQRVQKQAVDRVVDQLQSAFEFTRSQAVEKGRVTLICPTTDGRTCSTPSAWAKGWLVFQGQQVQVGQEIPEALVVQTISLTEPNIVVAIRNDKKIPQPFVGFDARGYSSLQSTLNISVCTSSTFTDTSRVFLLDQKGVLRKTEAELECS